MNQPGLSALLTPHYRRMTDSQIEAIHNAGLEILERVGVRFVHDKAVKMLASAGCRVSDGNVVHIPAWRVEWALNLAPKQIIIYNQTGAPAIRMAGRRTYYGNGCDLLHIVDHRTGERRRALLADNHEMIRLLDALPNYDFIMSGFLPSDVPGEKAEAWQTYVMLAETDKPLVNVTTDLANTVLETRMFELMAGGEDEFRHRPFAVNYINISKPLLHNPEAVDKLLYVAGKGLPVTYRPGLVLRSLTTPITPVGFLAANNAGGLAGLVLAQLVREGTPFIRCGCSGGTFDQRTTVGCHSAAEVRGFNEEIAHHYRLPTFGIGGTTESKCVDEQAVMEASLTLLTSTLAGSNLVHDLGYMESGLCGSLVQAAICDDIVSWINHFMPGLEINDDTLALDLIAEQGPDGHFLQTRHTMNHCREDEYSDLRDRANHDRWQAAGGLTLAERAREKVNSILEAHQPSGLTPDQDRALKDLMGV